MHTALKVGIGLFLAWGAWHWLAYRPVVHGPGVVAPEAPIQTAITGVKPFQVKDYTITPLAKFNLEARILSRTGYSYGREADLSPLDLALGWGAMSDETILAHFSITQSGRFYYWSTRQFPIPRAEVVQNSANMHMIPADAAVADTLQRFRVGEVVKLRGYLVQVQAPDGWHWNSSLTRDDSGAGACELIWVEAAEGSEQS
jgi:hypothetical protein